MAARTKRAEVPAPEASPASPALAELTGALPRLVEIPLEYLHPHPKNPRRDLGDLTELAESIRATGIRQPLTVVQYVDTDDEPDPKYFTTVIGHRRAAAAALAGRTTVPAIVDQALSPAQQLELMLVENVQRSDLSPVEEADGYQGLLDLGLDVDAIARETGRSESTVRRRLRLVGLPERAREKLHNGQATLAQADRLNDFDDDPELAAQLAKLLGSKDFDNELEKAVKKRRVHTTIEHLVTQLEAAGAKKIEAAHNGWTSPEGMLRVDYVSRYELQGGLNNGSVKSFVEKTAGADAGWAFAISRTSYDDNLHVFRPLTDEDKSPTAAAPAVDPERQRQLAEERAAAAAAAERHERFTGLRTAFLEGLRKRHLTLAQVEDLALFVARRHLVDAYEDESAYASEGRLHSWFGIDAAQIETAATEADPKADVEAKIELAVRDAIGNVKFDQALLALAVLVEEEELARSTWQRPNYAAPRTVAYYLLLERLGYQVSTEEAEAMRPPVEEAGVVEGAGDEDDFYDPDGDDLDEDGEEP